MTKRSKSKCLFVACAILSACLGASLAMLCLTRPLAMLSKEVRIFEAVNKSAQGEPNPNPVLRDFVDYCKGEWDRAGLVAIGVAVTNFGILFLVRWDARRTKANLDMPTNVVESRD